MSHRRLPCDCCGKEVSIQSQKRFLAMVHGNHKPLCEQCGRYIRPATARVPEVSKGVSLTALGLVGAIGASGKSRKPLASYRLGRCGVTGYESAREVDQ